jgi:hypothetical protein
MKQRTLFFLVLLASHGKFSAPLDAHDLVVTDQNHQVLAKMKRVEATRELNLILGWDVSEQRLYPLQLCKSDLGSRYRILSVTAKETAMIGLLSAPYTVQQRLRDERIISSDIPMTPDQFDVRTKARICALRAQHAEAWALYHSEVKCHGTPEPGSYWDAFAATLRCKDSELDSVERDYAELRRDVDQERVDGGEWVCKAHEGMSFFVRDLRSRSRQLSLSSAEGALFIKHLGAVVRLDATQGRQFILGAPCE